MAMNSGDLNKYLFQQLAGIAMSPTPARTNSYDIALQIMRNSNVNFGNVWNMDMPAPDTKKKGGGTSLFGHIIDIINRPLYATAGFAKGTEDAVKNKHYNPLNVWGDIPGIFGSGVEGAAKGFTGQEKHTWSQLLNETGEMPDNPVAKFGIGFAADMLGDPLSYVPVGGIAKAGVRGALKAAGKDVPTFFLPKAEKAALKAQKTAQARAGLSKLGERTPIVPENQTPSAFQFLSKAAADSGDSGVSKPLTNIGPPGSWTHSLNGEGFLKPPPPLPASLVHGSAQPLEELTLNSEKQAPKLDELFKNTNQISGEFPKATGSLAPTVFAKALEDAPVVETALDQGVKKAATAGEFLSEQSAKMVGKSFDQDAKEVFKATGVSPEAQKTYNQILGNVINQERGAPLTALDKAGSKLAIPVSSKEINTALRGPLNKGRFFKSGTELPTFSKAGTFKPGNSNVGKRIFSFDKVLQAASRADADKIVNSIEKPAPKVGVSDANIAMQQGTKTGALKFGSSPKGAIAIPSISQAAVKSGKGVFGPVNDQLTKAINSRITTPIRKLKIGERIDELSATQGIMARFATFMGQKDLRPLVLDSLGSATARANKRIQAIEAAFKGHSNDELMEAWELARGAKPRELATSPAVSDLADTMLQQMEKYFRSRLVPERFAKGNSVAMRSGMMMKDLNKALNRYKVPFQFTDKAATDPITHAPISYEKGSNWLISWETHIPKNASALKGFIFGLQSAVDNVIGQYSFVDDVAYRLGSRTKDSLRNVQVLHPRLADYFFDKDVADQLSTALKTMNDFYSPRSPIMKFFRSAITTWKTGVTIYSPRHHIANFIGDAYLAWIGGVNNPDVFRKSAKVLLANRGNYKDLATVDELVGTNALVSNFSRDVGKALVKNKSGYKMDAKDIYIGAFNYGILQGAKQVEDLAGSGFKMPIKPLGGKLHNAVTKFAEGREHFVRLAHFIDAIQKSRGNNPAQILEDAAHEVRKWHPDGMDLTKEEQAIRTYLIPFYSWSRKSIPLLVEGAAMNPHKAFTVYANMNYNAQQALGIQGTSPENPLPADQLFPSWLRENNTAVLGKPGLPGLAGFLGSLGRQKTDENGNPLNAYTLAGPTNPMQDLFDQFGGFTPGGMHEGVMSAVNPFLRVPLELDRGKQYHGNIPIVDKSDYATEQIPLVNQFARMTNLSPLSGKTNKAELYGVGNREATLNYFLNTNITGSGPYISMAEKAQAKEDNKKYRAFAESIGYPIKPRGKVPWWIVTLYNQRQGNQ